MKKILMVLAGILFVGCKGANNTVDNDYSSRDFAVSCLYGHYYMHRVNPQTYSLMAPIFDSTGKPAKCAELPRQLP